jgi:iron(III) transport system ATP-binding protein
MADHIAVMRDGVVVQTGEPREVYEHPADQFVAEFVGAANILDCTVTATGDSRDGLSEGHRRLRWSETDLVVAATEAASEGSRVSLLVRPEAIKVVPDGDSATNVFKGRVESLAYFGDGLDAWFEANGTSIRARLDPSVHIDKGSVVSLRFDPTSCGLLPTADRVEMST